MGRVLRRTPQLEVHEVPDGYIVYQSHQDKVLYLNKTAALVFEFCDGNLNDLDIIGRIARIYDLSAAGQDEIKGCIESLLREGLLESPSR
jgi:hypothetical protein